MERAINLAGSEAKLAAMARVSQPAVNKAKRRRVSAELAIAIHRALDGAVTAHELRPDLFPSGFVPPAAARGAA